MKYITTVSLSLLLTCSFGLSAQLGFAKSNQTESKLGKATYMASCECCHMMGKNVLKPGKDIVVSSKIADVKVFKEFISEKHGMMPAFPNIAEDENVANALYKYVKTLKNQTWNYEPEGIEKQDEEKTPPPKTPKNPKNQGAGSTR